MAARQRQIESSVDQGGVLEASCAACSACCPSVALWTSATTTWLRNCWSSKHLGAGVRLRAAIREQTLVMRQCGSAAIEAIPGLLKSTPADTIRRAGEAITQMAAIDKEPGAEDEAVRHALQQVQALFEQAALAQQPRIQEPLELAPAPVQTPAAPQRAAAAARRKPAAPRGKKGVR